MVTTKNLLALLFVFSIVGTGLTSCDSGQNQNSTVTPPATTEQSQDVPENADGEPMTSPSDTPTPEAKDPVTEPSTPPSTGIITPPTIVPPAVISPSPDNSGYKSVPKDTPMKPDVGNVESDGKGGILAPKDEVMPEVKKPAPKSKAESKTTGEAKTQAVATRKATFTKAVALVPGSKDAKFQEYYKKLETLVSKIEGQKPLTQESIDSVNKLNMEYPQEAMKFNEAMQKVLPTKKGG
jgi:hypothetical protein